MTDEVRFVLFLLLLLAAVWVDQARGAGAAGTESASAVRVEISRQ